MKRMSEHVPRRVAAGLRDRQLLRRIVVVGLLAFAVGYGLTALLLFGGGPDGVVITVPDVRRLDAAQARRQLVRAELTVEFADSLPNPLVPAGAVVAQSPLPGQEVGPGSRIRLILSSGRERRTIPEVATLTREQAVKLLEASGLRVVPQEVRHARAAGRVVGTQPAAGTTVAVPAAVRLLISAGPPMVEVPSLAGLFEGEARAALEAAGLRMGEVERVFHLRDAEGAVLGQIPSPGDSTRLGSAVSLRVVTHQLPGRPVPDAPDPAPAPEPEQHPAAREGAP